MARERTDTKAVFALTERDGRTFWTRIGLAFGPNRDGSITCKLDALPVSGQLQIRDDEPQTRGRNDRSRDERENDER